MKNRTEKKQKGENVKKWEEKNKYKHIQSKKIIHASWGKYRPKQLVQIKIWGMEAEDA
jgi:hypothetical protein